MQEEVESHITGWWPIHRKSSPSAQWTGCDISPPPLPVARLILNCAISEDKQLCGKSLSPSPRFKKGRMLHFFINPQTKCKNIFPYCLGMKDEFDSFVNLVRKSDRNYSKLFTL